MESNKFTVPLPEPAGGAVTLKIAWPAPFASTTLPHAAPATPVTPTASSMVPVQAVAVPELIEARTEVLGILLGPDNAAVALESQAYAETPVWLAAKL